MKKRKEEIERRLLSDVAFKICLDCGRFYWCSHVGIVCKLRSSQR